ncbi:MAG: tRNA (adenosine(37)-N6)-threonylcarbamoyltransferase complex transferase subunit TsaD [Candidatus Pacebacteria bacterium]|nr:tRNA (adenosine(37)-N6)-threonylcarbamoyltransferase complex transferase subunit TsaD [Candidatus Paceibacterota bacterium]
MKLLAIETSCDETALAILTMRGTATAPHFSVLSHHVASQISLHEQYGGVFPAMAKREHAKNIVPLLEKTLSDANLLFPFSLKKQREGFSHTTILKVEKLLVREKEMFEQLIPYLRTYKKPDVDAIAVTVGPGLEPALWVGINLARVLSYLWDIPIVPVNHMEGHILSFLVSTNKDIQELSYEKFDVPFFQFPILSLLVSGGHTEIVLVKKWGAYTVLGSNVDDAVGEAFDKVARMLGLSYPGGPKISALAEEVRKKMLKNKLEIRSFLPRPMLYSGDFKFSYSGLKTAVLYYIRDLTNQNKRSLTPDEKKSIAFEFENAAIEVLVSKTLRAIKKYNIRVLVVGGGVAANSHLRKELTDQVSAFDASIQVHFPIPELSTDNAIMIGIAGGLHFLRTKKGVKYSSKKLLANGNMSL